MAASVLRHKAAAAGLTDLVAVESTGTGGWHVGEGADARAQTTLRANGYDASHTARQFRRDEARHVDLLLAMDTANLESLRRVLGPDPRVRMFRSFDPALARLTPPDPRLDVPDPYYGGNDGFRQVLAMVERAADGLVAHLRATVPDAGN
ncbi:MAG: low molecular weight protein-tyrosine phosphatase [Actinomycetota bacterium]|nr:low molecular weight protein-tyrosine phosphatase [Actinomycetota bacterium]